jgi:hypothetical protein
MITPPAARPITIIITRLTMTRHTTAVTLAARITEDSTVVGMAVVLMVAEGTIDDGDRVTGSIIFAHQAPKTVNASFGLLSDFGTCSRFIGVRHSGFRAASFDFFATREALSGPAAPRCRSALDPDRAKVKSIHTQARANVRRVYGRDGPDRRREESRD